MFQDLLWCLYYLIFNPNLEVLMNWRIFYWTYAQMFLTQLFWNSNTYLSLVSKKNLKKFCKGSVWNSPLIHKCLNEFIIILCYVHFVYKHGQWTPREEIVFTARQKIQSQSQIFRYGRSIFLSASSAQFFRYLWFMPSLGVRSPCCHAFNLLCSSNIIEKLANTIALATRWDF